MVKQWEAAVATRREKAQDPSQVRDRFLAKVKHVDGDCWAWVGARRGADDYGLFWMDGRLAMAHRASYVIFKGEIADGLVVRHACDNRWCVNPAHLDLGTQQENMQDMITRKRQRSGTAKLTAAQVAAIKAEYVKRDGELGRLSEKYGVGIGAIHSIVSNRNWKKIEAGESPTAAEAFQSKRARGAAHHKSKMTEGLVRDLRQARKDGVSLDACAAWFTLSKPQVSAIATGRNWGHVQ